MEAVEEDSSIVIEESEIAEPWHEKHEVRLTFLHAPWTNSAFYANDSSLSFLVLLSKI